MYELVIQSDFSAAHRLRSYDGDCERLHGHNWRVDALFEAEELNSLGMVADFRVVKRLLEELLREFDHQDLNELERFSEQNPSTENIARAIYQEFSYKLPHGMRVKKITVWESDHCGASYFE